jgi:hypothetical protein
MNKTHPLTKCEWDLFNSQKSLCQVNCADCSFKDSCEALYLKVDSLRPGKTSSKYLSDREWQVFCKYLDTCQDARVIREGLKQTADCDNCTQRETCEKLFTHVERMCKRYCKELNRILDIDRGNPCVTACGTTLNITPLSILDIRGFSAVGTGEWR